jgi:hypothetical protein
MVRVSSQPPLERHYESFVRSLNYESPATHLWDRCLLSSCFGDAQDRQVERRMGAGIMVCAETVAEAFDAMYYLEQAARVTVKALSTGQKLKIVDEKVLSLLTHNIVLALEAQNALCSETMSYAVLQKRRLWQGDSGLLSVSEKHTGCYDPSAVVCTHGWAM